MSNVLSEANRRALDHPIWSALTGGHRALALGDELARRYPRAIGPLAGIRESTQQSFDALTALIPSDGPVALFTVEKIMPPPNLEIQMAGTIYQMIAVDQQAPISEGPKPISLGFEDVPEMIRLVELTKPGPFGPRTHELGSYLGIRDGGQLVAMAGERMRFDDFVEISAVCVRADHRGKGYAQILMSTLMRQISERGSTPILHVFTHNTPAIKVYEKLGLVIRTTLHVTALQHSGSEAGVVHGSSVVTA